MSNELESDRELYGDELEFRNLKFWSRWCWLRYDRDRAAKFDNPAVRIMLQVTQIQVVRFLLERGLRFRNLATLVVVDMI